MSMKSGLVTHQLVGDRREGGGGNVVDLTLSSSDSDSDSDDHKHRSSKQSFGTTSSKKRHCFSYSYSNGNSNSSSNSSNSNLTGTDSIHHKRLKVDHSPSPVSRSLCAATGTTTGTATSVHAPVEICLLDDDDGDEILTSEDRGSFYKSAGMSKNCISISAVNSSASSSSSSSLIRNELVRSPQVDKVYSDNVFVKTSPKLSTWERIRASNTTSNMYSSINSYSDASTFADTKGVDISSNSNSKSKCKHKSSNFIDLEPDFFYDENGFPVEIGEKNCGKKQYLGNTQSSSATSASPSPSRTQCLIHTQAQQSLYRYPAVEEYLVAEEVQVTQNTSLERLVTAPNLDASICGIVYHDMRDRYLHSLMQELAHNKYHNADHAHNKPKRDSLTKAITHLALYPFPIRTIESFGHLVDNCGEGKVDILQHGDHNKATNNTYYGDVPVGQFLCAAPAALLCMLDHVLSQPSTASKDESYISLEDLLIRASAYIYSPGGLRNRLDQPVEYYKEENNNFSSAFNSITCLEKPEFSVSVSGNKEASLIKRRANRKKCVSGVCYELLPEGRKFAERLRSLVDLDCRSRRNAATTTTTTVILSKSLMPHSMGPARQLLSNTMWEKYEGVTVAIDSREGGGEHKKLHEMCDYLEKEKIPFFIRNLCCGDFLFFLGSYVAPVVVERKTRVDIAKSMRDSRWVSQKKNMRKAQYVLGGPGRRCELFYLIEGNLHKDKLVGGYVVDGISKEDVEHEIEKLNDEGFNVIMSGTGSASLALNPRRQGGSGRIKDLSMSALAEVILKNFNSGVYSEHDLFSYDEFSRRLKACPDSEGLLVADVSYFCPSIEGHDAAQRVALETRRDVRDEGGGRVEVFNNQNNGAAAGGGGGEIDVGQVGATILEYRHRNYTEDDFRGMTISRLKDICKARCLTSSAKSKDELIQTLQGPQIPDILKERMWNGGHTAYLPRMPSSAAAFLIALLLIDTKMEGLTEDRIMQEADKLELREKCGKKISIYETHGYYTAFQCMAKLIDSEVVVKQSGKTKLYRLSAVSGVAVARAVHQWAHDSGSCEQCARLGGPRL